ncbi:uncharacterized protein [Clytia hemisphaerica]|uniref:Uncharacterized protein n=1 Tax=Clytia hemisphaerica TaxID=252671 RepID=A0A7M5VEV1_9CNID
MDKVNGLLGKLVENIQEFQQQLNEGKGREPPPARTSTQNEASPHNSVDARMRSLFNPSGRERNRDTTNRDRTNRDRTKQDKENNQVLNQYVKDMWTREFCVLPTPSSDRSPSREISTTLNEAGLGKTAIVFKK